MPKNSVEGRVRRPFRILGWIFGPLFIAGGIGFLLGAVVTQEHLLFISLGLGGISFGTLFVRAAITGRDPYVRW